MGPCLSILWANEMRRLGSLFGSWLEAEAVVFFGRPSRGSLQLVASLQARLAFLDQHSTSESILDGPLQSIDERDVVAVDRHVRCGDRIDCGNELGFLDYLPDLSGDFPVVWLCAIRREWEFQG